MCILVTLCFVTIEVHSVNLESYISMSLWINCMSDSLRNVASRTVWTLFYTTIISSELLREYLKEKNSACSHSPLKLLITVTCNNAWTGIPKCNCHLKFFPLQKCSGCNENAHFFRGKRNFHRNNRLSSLSSFNALRSTFGNYPVIYSAK